MNSELCARPASQLAGLVLSKEISARELTRAYLDRIAALDATLGSYLLVDDAGALAAAAEIDKAIARGEKVGPLAGVPLALKDIFVTRGMETTSGSKILKGWLPPYDGTAVARLKQAGAVLLGKLNMDEFAMGSSNENSSVKKCRNPWDFERVPGGSSGGSAAAVAAALCAGSLGTDTGGSIRQPASLCGIVGLKPTYGRVSRYGVIAFASSLDQVGPMTRTVEDAAYLLEIIAGHDPLDSTSINSPVPRYREACREGVKGLTIGIPDEYFVPGMDPEVESAVRKAIKDLESLGARIEPIRLPHTEYAVACYYLIATAEASSNLARFDGVRYGLRVAGPKTSLQDMYCQTRGEGFGLEVKRRIMLGTFALRSGYYDAYYKKAQQVRTLIKRDFDEALARVDVIATPASPTPAFKLGEKTENPLEMYLADIFTISCNLAGLPGISVPCGFTKNGLPIGIQFLGKPLAETTLLRTAAAYERHAGWYKRRPPENMEAAK
ncbi:MAG: Asp-tRNA(Asn)/Glu-tRNA(Gln) amidotransferase subunit GatA [Deltaproteobacteria bacterium]|nr:Asp-tRNA(Asn)/Glu-tRNA(Gln) amidotransferase subunit GatA [Deltaproteobacteria bacterium]